MHRACLALTFALLFLCPCLHADDLLKELERIVHGSPTTGTNSTKTDDLMTELRDLLHPNASNTTNPLVFPSTVTLGEGLKILHAEQESEGKDHFQYLKKYIPELHRSDLDRISPADLKEFYYKAFRAQGLSRKDARLKSEDAVE
jgi:hypothetical protein